MNKKITAADTLISLTGVLTFILLLSYACICFLPASAYASSASAERREIKILKNQIKAEVEQLKEIESKIHHIKAAQQAKIKNLIPVYSSMSPRKAAAILPGINKSVAIYNFIAHDRKDRFSYNFKNAGKIRYFFYKCHSRQIISDTFSFNFT